MEEDQEICRVCRCESTLTKPLYHPCKCTGSIRFIHQDCLLEWLAHSRKDYCELCEHPFVFTPIYRQDMPAQIPLYLLIGQCILRGGASLKTALRGLVVGIVWLVLLPYMILWSWRLCFSPSVNIDGWHSDDETRISFEYEPHHSSDSPLSEYGIWEFLIDCFKGQVITMGLLLVVAATYIFKEWMAQNIPLEAEQEPETEQDVDVPLKVDDIDINIDQQYQHICPGGDDNDTISVLTRQQIAVDALMDALNELDNDDDTSAKNDGNDLKKQLEDLQNDLRHEIEKTQQSHHQEHHDLQQDRDRQQQQQQHHAYHQLDNDTNATTGGKGWMNSDFFQLNTDDDDETQVENMMQSIMVQDPAKASTRYSWDDLLQSNNNNNSNQYYKQQQQHQQSLYLKHDSLVSSSLLSTTSTTTLDNKSPFSTNDQLLDNNTLIPRPTTVGKDLHYHQLAESIPISINLQRSTNRPDSASTSKNKHLSMDNSLNDIFSRPKLSTPPSSLSQQHFIFEKGNHHGSNVTHRQQASSMESTQTISSSIANHQNQHIDTNDDDNALDEEGMEDGIFNLGDDIDGVLEAIGMRGDLWVLLQNSILAFIIISCCLGVAVCLPYFIGRWMIMIRPLEKLIGALQYVTDPLVDYTLDHWLNPLMVANPIHLILDLFIPNGVFWFPLFNNDSISHNNHLASPSAASSSPWSLKNFQHTTSTGKNGTTAASFMTNHHTLVMTELKTTIHALSGNIIERWHQFAIGQSGLDRGVCTIIGYLTLLCLGSWYLTYQRHQQYASANNNNNNNNMMQQVGMFVKVGSFVLLELGVLPLLCGVLLDWVTLPLVADASILTPLVTASSWHWTTGFLHWLVGTCFIYETAVFITLCRATVRPGVLWFIRDTNDPNFQPIQDIMDRPLFGLLGKLCMAALIYVTLIVGALGSVIWAISRYTRIQHLRWTFSEPLISVATDILAAQFLLPILVAYIKPRDSFKKTLSQWWHVLAHQLRLSSFMFGERYPLEEGVYVNAKWKNSWMSSVVAPNITPDLSAIGKHDDDDDTSMELLLQMDGKLARVPNQDTIKSYYPQQRMIVPVDPDTLEPIDPSEKTQDGLPAANDQSSGGGEQDNTIVVYLPPHFKIRVVLFVISMWLCGSVMACSLTVAPILLGRLLLETWIAPGKQLHDLYSYILGVCVMTVSTNAIRSIAQGTINYLKQDGGGHDGLLIYLLDKLSACVRQKILNGCKLLYLTFMIGWLIPLLTGLAVDLYIFAPFRSNTAFASSQLALISTTLDFSGHWNNGLLYLGVMYRLTSILPTNAWQRTMDQYMVGGLSSLDLWTLTRTILVPWFTATSGAIIIPGGSAWIILHLLAVQDISMKLRIMQCVYFGVLSLVAILAVVILGMKLLNLWMRVVRDDTYLIGKQLHNLDDQVQQGDVNNSVVANGGIKTHTMH